MQRKDNKGQDMIDITLDDGFFPPPWNFYEHPEKTEGWIEFQKHMRKDPEYYSFQPERSKREDYKVTTINSVDCPKIEMPIDKDILTKYKWDSIDAVL
jgi:hypothetical protein